MGWADGTVSPRPRREAAVQTRRASVVGSDPSFDSATVRSGEGSLTATTTKFGRRAAPNEFRVSGLLTWTGRVVEVAGDMFTAELVPDQHTPGGPVLGDFFKSEVGAGTDDIGLGDVIYVTKRTVRPANGGLPHQTSAVRLRRLGKWSRADVARFDADGEKMFVELEGLMG